MKVVLLAAGKSSRMWPLAQHKNKCMYELLGKPLLYHTLTDLKKIGFKDIIVVVSQKDGSIKNYLGNGKKFGFKIEYVIQKKPLGMGNALLCAKHLLKGSFLVVNARKADVIQTLKPMLALYKKKRHHIIVAGKKTDKPWMYGILKIRGSKVLQIVEKPERGKEPSKYKIEGVYIFNEQFLKMLKKRPTKEYSFEETLQHYIEKNNSVFVIKLKGIAKLSLKYPWDLFEINKWFLNKIKKSRISKKAKIHKTAIIKGKVIIEDDVIVHEHATIKGPCYIGESTVIGNNALVREYSSIGRDCVIGFNTDVKHSILFNNVKVDMCYIGDSIIDNGVRLGAGTITANRRLDRASVKTIVKNEKTDTGIEFFGSVIGKDVKTGVHVSLMPGTKIGQNSILWPNTVILQDVPDNSVVSFKAKTIIKKR